MFIILTLFVFKIKLAYVHKNSNLESEEIVINEMKLQTEQHILENRIVIENQQNNVEEYFVTDEQNVENELTEMYEKYNCNNIDDVENSSKNNYLDYGENFNNTYCLNISEFDNEYKNFVKNIQLLIESKHFIYLFNIIELDLKNIIINANKYLYGNDDRLKKNILELKKYQHKTHKIKRFLYITKKYLNIDTMQKTYTNLQINSFFNNKLKTKYRKNEHNFKLKYKFQSKLRFINKYMQKKSETLNKFFIYTKQLINLTTDNQIKISIIFGLQNLFLNDIYHSMPRFIN